MSDKFIVRKYNLATPNTIPYCGKFVDESQNVYFHGHIQKSEVIDFGLAFKKPKLCAINDDAKIFNFEKTPIPK